jgi:alkanesulfonate monooxygenase SsuD/methylene tetrahydromethanopterin reductase-like flavin-dependent oxidoreductase (luciferase family)
MEFATFHVFTCPEELPQDQALRDEVAIMCFAEEAGYDRVWLAEHHFSPWGILGNPLAMLAHLAGVTRRIRLGVAVSILPFHHPIRLAEDAALVDVLSGGRLDWGIGRGYQKQEFEGWQLSMDESRARFEEALDFVLRAWSGESLAHDGAFYRVGDVRTFPPPVQRPHPPVWVAANSPETIAWAAGRAIPLLTTQAPTFAQLGDFRRRFEDELRSAGHPEAVVRERLGRSAAVRYVYVAPTDAEAFAEPRAALDWIAASAPKYASPGGRDRVYSPAYRWYEERAHEALTRPRPDFAQKLEDTLLIGSPARVRAQLSRFREESGFANLICMTSFGGQPIAQVRRSMRLFADEVMPHFR